MGYEITMKDISKKYDSDWILQGVNQIFQSGISYAFVGHNGCGKSTLLRILSGLSAPTKGEVCYSRKLTFAYVPDHLPPLKLTGRGYLKAMGDIGKIPEKELGERIDTLADAFFFREMLDTSLGKLSRGTLQKVAVTQALLIDTDVILLDEPLSGQDQESQQVFVEKINALRDRGAMVFLACHEAWLTEALADQAFTIRDRKLVAV